MRKSKAEAAHTRERIVRAAAESFRRNGIDATGLNEIMGAAGLTHGGFYKHFGSKNELVAEACMEGADDVAGRASCVVSMVADYLDDAKLQEQTCDCPFVSLGSELARGTEAVREAANERFTDMLAKTEAKLAGSHSDARDRALAALAGMVGGLTLARIVTDPELSRDILRSVRDSVARDVLSPAATRPAPAS